MVLARVFRTEFKRFKEPSLMAAGQFLIIYLLPNVEDENPAKAKAADHLRRRNHEP
jgi:hypothetical protein